MRVARAGSARGAAFAAVDAGLIEALLRADLLSGMERPALESIAPLVLPVNFATGEEIFTQSGACQGVWIVASGRVRVYHSFSEGRQQVVGFLGEGSTPDLASAVDGGRHSVSASAITAVQMLLVPREQWGEITRRYPPILANAVWQLCREVRRYDIITGLGAQKDARGRIECALLQMARQHGQANDQAIKIDCRLSRQDLADHAGVRIETAIRVLSDMQRQGLIKTRARVIEVLDLQALRLSSGCEGCLFDCSVFNPGKTAEPGSFLLKPESEQ